jgi:DEAD/DEAH box helicase domain-containing protein
VGDDALVVRGGKAYYAGQGAPAAAVSLRTGSNREYRIVLGNDATLLGVVDESRAFEQVHPGAIYLHQGQEYRVSRLDLSDRAAWVEPVDPGEMTQARSDSDIVILDEEQWMEIGRARLSLGPVEVTEQVTGYRRKDYRTGEVLGDEPLDLPPTRLITRAFWYTVAPSVLIEAGVTEQAVPGTLHAAEHAGIGMLPLFTICDRWDVGGVSTAWQIDTGLPTIVIYDGYPGGAGIAELGFAAGRRHLEATLEAIVTCPCRDGCPSCIQSPKCGNLNDPLDKSGAIAFLRTVLA